MRPNHHQSSHSALKAAPALITLLIALMGLAPTHMRSLQAASPEAALVCIFYWGVYSPGALPYSFLFVMGLVQDSIAGTPLGLQSFINMGVMYLIHSQRRLMGRAQFAVVWGSGVLLVALALLSQWAIMCLYSGKTYPVLPVMLRLCVTAVTYPLLHMILTQIYKRIQVR